MGLLVNHEFSLEVSSHPCQEVGFASDRPTRGRASVQGRLPGSVRPPRAGCVGLP